MVAEIQQSYRAAHEECNRAQAHYADAETRDLQSAGYLSQETVEILQVAGEALKAEVKAHAALQAAVRMQHRYLATKSRSWICACTACAPMPRCGSGPK
jgi:hypothetical protein